jgi:hypothetical protein
LISAKGLIEMAKNDVRHRMTALARKRLASTLPEETEGPSTSVGSKGHFAAYSVDAMRLEVPLAYLGMTVSSELLEAVS